MDLFLSVLIVVLIVGMALFFSAAILNSEDDEVYYVIKRDIESGKTYFEGNRCETESERGKEP